MKKLYVNITMVKILKGGANMLTTAVTDIDRAVERLANETSSMHNTLMRYSATEKGEEYKRATDEVRTLAIKLSGIAQDLNGFQHDIVKLQEKIKQYERDRSPNAMPRRLSVEALNVTVNTAIIEFHADEMRTVVNSIGSYIENTRGITRELKSKKDSLSAVWQDPQYRSVFSPYIDEIERIISKSTVALSAYKDDLRNRIIKLESN